MFSYPVELCIYNIALSSAGNEEFGVLLVMDCTPSLRERNREWISATHFKLGARMWL